MDAIANAKPMSKDDMPGRAPRGPGLGKEGTLVADLLKLLPKTRARALHVAARPLPPSDDLHTPAAGPPERTPTLVRRAPARFRPADAHLTQRSRGFPSRTGTVGRTQ